MGTSIWEQNECTPPVASPSPDEKPLVVLDVGHSLHSAGAISPDGRVRECYFWYRNVCYIVHELERNGVRVVVCNRGKKPKQEPFATTAKALPVVHLNDPDTGKRYPSRYHPEHIGAGMVSADYGISLKPDCMVFLHLNSVGSKWRIGVSQGIVMHNKNCGRALAAALCNRLNKEIFCHESGKGLGSKPCKPIVRENRELGGAGWLNTTDAEGIPAAVIEAFYVDVRSHVDYLSNSANAMRVAHAVAAGIVDWLRARSEKQQASHVSTH